MADKRGKLTFLGTGGDGIVIGKQILASGGIIFQYGDTQLHIDPGPGSLVKAKQHKINLRETTCILASQNSLFRTGDVNAAIAAMTHHGLDKRGVLICNETLYRGAEGFQTYLNKNEREMVERALSVRPGQKIGINDVDISILRSYQKDPNALGFRIVADGKSIGIPCETILDTGLFESYKGVDLLILNVRMPGNLQEEGAMNTRDATTLLKKLRPKTCLITGFGIKMVDADPREEARSIGRESGVHVEAVSDGQKFSVDEMLQSL
ncbi:MAG: hypothetical protein GXP63_05705 [DPANN group archaeon]|nr:hypothetical protein [DPANN group archaeon]